MEVRLINEVARWNGKQMSLKFTTKHYSPTKSLNPPTILGQGCIRVRACGSEGGLRFWYLVGKRIMQAYYWAALNAVHRT